MVTLNQDNAGRLLSIAEQRRQHWAIVISSLNGLAMTLILGIWTFFLKWFLDKSSFVNPPTDGTEFQPFAFSYIIMAAGLSAIVLALWRCYARYLDDCIANTYREIMHYEQILGIDHNSGITKYIAREKTIKEVMPELCQGQQRQLVEQLVKDKHIGRRGHGWIDSIVFTLIFVFIVMIAIDIYIQYSNIQLYKMVSPSEILSNPLLALKYVGYVLIVLSCGILIFVFCYFQKNPKKEYIRQIVNKIKAECQK